LSNNFKIIVQAEIEKLRVGNQKNRPENLRVIGHVPNENNNNRNGNDDDDEDEVSNESFPARRLSNLSSENLGSRFNSNFHQEEEQQEQQEREKNIQQVNAELAKEQQDREALETQQEHSQAIGYIPNPNNNNRNRNDDADDDDDDVSQSAFENVDSLSNISTLQLIDTIGVRLSSPTISRQEQALQQQQHHQVSAQQQYSPAARAVHRNAHSLVPSSAGTASSVSAASRRDKK
jgi:hypothetical protein